MEINNLAVQLMALNYTLATAESCTGGLVAKYCTDVAGSSKWFDRGFITYSNQAKEEMLNVAASTLKKYGAVSQQVAEEMSRGVQHNSQSTCAIAITGIAGPSGGSKDKPVGTVWIAWAIANEINSTCYQFYGNREKVREQAAVQAIKNLTILLKK